MAKKLIEGNITCNNENCKKKINWYYLVPQDVAGYVSAFLLPEEKVSAKKIETLDFNIYRLSVECPYCEKENIIVYSDKY